jgi:hypothetical protein
MTWLSSFIPRKLNESPWFDVQRAHTFRGLVEREVLFTIGRSKAAPDLDMKWRITIRRMHRAEVNAQIARIFALWPARKIVP